MEDFFIHKIIGEIELVPGTKSNISLENMHSFVITFKDININTGLYTVNNGLRNGYKLIIPNDSFGNNDTAEGVLGDTNNNVSRYFSL